MYGLSESEVKRIVAAHGAVILDCLIEPYGGFESRWSNYSWCVRK